MRVTGLPQQLSPLPAGHEDEAEKSREAGGVSMACSWSDGARWGPDLGVVTHIPPPCAAQAPPGPSGGAEAG